MNMDYLKRYKHLKVEEICRICLITKNEMVVIKDIAIENLLATTSIQISEEDRNHFLCVDCLNELNKWNEFTQRVIKSFRIGHWLIEQKCKFEKHTEVTYVTQDMDDSLEYQEKIIILVPNDNSDVAKYENEDELPHVKTSAAKRDINDSLECNEKKITLVPNDIPNSLKCENVDAIPHVKKSEKETFINDGSSKILEDKSDCTIKSEVVIKDTVDELNLKNFNCEQTDVKPLTELHSECSKEEISKNFECQKCFKRFARKQNLNEHMKRHYNSRNFVCSICGKKFYKPSDVVEHMRTHTGERPFMCEFCTKTFIRGLSLKRHIRKVHANIKRFMCGICNKSFCGNYRLKIHMRSHTGEKPHQCPECAKSFAVTSQLTSHIKYIHTQQKDFICNVCARAFVARHTLVAHMRTHTGEKREARHECMACGKKCITTTHLKMHIKSQHTGERPYECELCNKCFLTKHALAYHVRTHTGERPFPCDECGKAFAIKSTLQIHSRIHTGEKPYECEICDKSFAHANTFRNHMNRTHKLKN